MTPSQKLVFTHNDVITKNLRSKKWRMFRKPATATFRPLTGKVLNRIELSFASDQVNQSTHYCEELVDSHYCIVVCVVVQIENPDTHTARLQGNEVSCTEHALSYLTRSETLKLKIHPTSRDLIVAQQT